MDRPTARLGGGGGGVKCVANGREGGGGHLSSPALRARQRRCRSWPARGAAIWLREHPPRTENPPAHPSEGSPAAIRPNMMQKRPDTSGGGSEANRPPNLPAQWVGWCGVQGWGSCRAGRRGEGVPQPEPRPLTRQPAAAGIPAAGRTDERDDHHADGAQLDDEARADARDLDGACAGRRARRGRGQGGTFRLRAPGPSAARVGAQSWERARGRRFSNDEGCASNGYDAPMRVPRSCVSMFSL